MIIVLHNDLELFHISRILIMPYKFVSIEIEIALISEEFPFHDLFGSSTTTTTTAFYHCLLKGIWSMCLGEVIRFILAGDQPA